MRFFMAVLGTVVLGGCAGVCTDSKAVQQACPTLPTLSDRPTTDQLAAYASQVVELYGKCASIHTTVARADAGS